MNERETLHSDWMSIARKDWTRIYRMLGSEDIKKNLTEAKKFIKAMFSHEILKE